MLRDAIAMVGPAAGQQIVTDGPTDELAQSSRPPMDTSRYGNRWSPALVAWTSVAITDSRGHLYNVSGIVHLDGPALTEITTRRGGHEIAVAIVAHELGHLLGLDHTEEPDQLMNAKHSGQTSLGDGDRRGLAALAAVPCTREL